MPRKLIINFSATEKFEEIGYELKSVIRRAISGALDIDGFDYPTVISVTLCSPEYIHSLNNKFRGVDKPTDVLSFPMYEREDFCEEEFAFGASLGDIVISVPRAKAQAAELGNSFLREVAFLAAHSTLHLLGYDHERSEEEDKLQCDLQKKVVESLGID